MFGRCRSYGALFIFESPSYKDVSPTGFFWKGESFAVSLKIRAAGFAGRSAAKPNPASNHLIRREICLTGGARGLTW
jgi:hypothetical protein